MSVSYCLLQAHVERIKNCQTLAYEDQSRPNHLDVLVAKNTSETQEQQVPVAVLGHNSFLLQSHGLHFVLARTAEGNHVLQALTRCPQHSQASRSGSSRQPAVLHCRKLSLKGPPHAAAAQQIHPSITAATATPAVNTAWQLQQHSQVPYCKGLQQLPGTVTCCCLLVNGPQSQQQQVEQVQQLLQTAGAWSSSVTSSQLLDTLAVAAAAAATAIDSCSAVHAAVQFGPVHCTNGLYAAAEAALRSGTIGKVPANSSSSSSNSANKNNPPCIFLVGSSTGQLWVCHAAYALLGAANNESSKGAAQAPGETAHQQQQHRMSSPRFLLDLQQHIIALLPLPTCTAPDGSCSSSIPASAFLVVGSLGRVGVLHVQHTRQGADMWDTADQPTAAAAGSTEESMQLAMTQQQLPFVVKAAQLVRHPSSWQQEQPQEQQQHGMSLLLLSGSGSMYVADLTAAAGLSSAAAMGYNNNSSSSSSSSSNTSGKKTLVLQPVKLHLPGVVSRFWAVPGSEHTAVNTCSGSAGGGGGTRSSSSSSSSSSGQIIVQMQGSNELLLVELDRRSLFQQQQRQHCQAPGQAWQAAGQPIDTNAHAVAAATRQKLQGLMSALETLSIVRQSLEQSIKAQDSYLVAVGQDLTLLKALHRAPTPPAAAAAAAGGLPPDSNRIVGGGRAIEKDLQLSCDVTLQGLWPAPAAAVHPSSTNCSSSMQMAISVQLHILGSSSNSSSSDGVSELGFGPGWQLLVGFMPESARHPSWQTTVPANLTTLGSSSTAGSSRRLCASLLLPLPDACLKLSEGGWLQVYAVKEPPKSVQPMHQQRQQQGSGEALSCLPAVVLLTQQYISVMQLSSMLAANPAAAGLSAAVTAAAATGPAAAPVPGKSYSCILQLQAARSAAVGITNDLGQQQQQQQQQQQHGAQPLSHKRPRTDMQQAAQHLPQQPQLQKHQDQQEQQNQLGANLGNWLESIALVRQQGSASSGSGSSSLRLPGHSDRVSLLHGQVGYNLVFGAQGQLSWASRPLMPPQQQQQQGRHGPADAAAARNSQHPDLVTLPVQVGMQATDVAGLAQMHRAYSLAVLQQLSAAVIKSKTHSLTASRDSSSVSCGKWCIMSEKQQLQKALQQMRLLQQQLMQLQDTAEEALGKREQLLSALQSTAPAGAGQATDCSPALHPLQQQAGADPGLRCDPVDAAKWMTELKFLLNQWESGIHAGYARMLLAMSTAACITCLEQ